MLNIAALINTEKGIVKFHWASDGDERDMISVTFHGMGTTKRCDSLTVWTTDFDKPKCHFIHDTSRVIINKKDGRGIWNTLVWNGWTVGEIKWRT